MQVFPCRKIGPLSLQLPLNPVYSSADIRHRNSENFPDDVVRDPVQVEQHERFIQFPELIDQVVQQPKLSFQLGRPGRRRRNFKDGLVGWHNCL